jgi:hypothetical protein
MKGTSTSSSTDSNSFWDSTPSDNQRFHFTSNKTPSTSYQPLVNTSKPAREAPKLEVGTLASLTKQTTAYTPLSKQSKPANVQSDDDFPSLGGSKKVTNTSLNTTYASLARRWGEQKKEDEERAKKEASELAEKKRLQMEKDEKERRLFRIRTYSINALSKKNNDDEKYDLGNNNNNVYLDDDDSYHSYSSDNDGVDDDDDQENDEELDDTWNHRRSKNDLY